MRDIDPERYEVPDQAHEEDERGSCDICEANGGECVHTAIPLVCPTCHGEGEGCNDSYHKILCEKCEERPATHQVLMREEVLSDERGTVWGHVDVWLCDECDRETGPDPDVLYDEWRDRQMERED